MKKSLTGIMLLLVSTVFAQELPTYQCKKTDKNIEVDGKINDKAWSKAEEAKFVNFDGTEPRLKTTFKWMWDDKYLYGAFYVEDDHIWATMKNHDEYLWTENVVEFFINADGSPKSYVEIEINPQNAILDLFVLNKYNARKDIRQLWNWDCEGLKSAVDIHGSLNNPDDTDSHWTFEIAIPFDQIYTSPNNIPLAGDSWSVDFCRGEGNEKKGSVEVSAWSPPAFHNPLSYGKFIFVE